MDFLGRTSAEAQPGGADIGEDVDDCLASDDRFRGEGGLGHQSGQQGEAFLQNVVIGCRPERDVHGLDAFQRDREGRA
jgi:hypothetical protein